MPVEPTLSVTKNVTLYLTTCYNIRHDFDYCPKYIVCAVFSSCTVHRKCNYISFSKDDFATTTKFAGIVVPICCTFIKIRPTYTSVFSEYVPPNYI